MCRKNFFHLWERSANNIQHCMTDFYFLVRLNNMTFRAMNIFLLYVGALKLSNLESVILDWTWRDAKQRRLMDIPEVCQRVLDGSCRVFILRAYHLLYCCHLKWPSSVYGSPDCLTNELGIYARGVTD